MTTKTKPKCPSCGQVFRPGHHWHGANYCRALLLLDTLVDHSGMSAAELAKQCGMPFGDAQKGMTKLRDHDAVDFWCEERDQGGIRYRFRAKLDHETLREAFLEHVRRAEAVAAEKNIFA
jgi:transcription initiation factor IIE alpha subunit